MANLFGKNKLHEIAAAVDTESVKEYIAIVAEWHEDYHNGSLRKDKETSREQEYNHAFFKSILGYKEKPATPFSFEPKATTDMGQLPDAVISYTDSASGIRNIAAVVELKGAGIDLDRPQRRDGNMSPVQQGFKYKVQYSSVPFVIVSNFLEFRLYHDNLLDYEVWTLDDLVNPEDDYILFKTWFVLLKKDSLTSSKGVSKTEELLSDIRIEQENIGKKFYKVYKEARLNLLRDIYSQNDHIKTDIDTGIQKAQKIIDRVVFAAFAEDRGLLPDNTLQRVIKAADSSVYGGSLWNTLKGFFEAIDIGSEKLEIPNGYNGGLFKHDEVLNNLRISDEPLRNVVELGTYNYAEDLSVNILGHIFEQSISDLEEIKNKVNESNSLETLAQSRRKKDGIFYTPDYIVRYIVDNSLGAYLREHEEKFKAEFGLKGSILDKTYEKRERQAYTKYQDFLQNVKVVDPACGSGAFLVYVFDYLLAENKRVGDILGMSLFSSDEYVRDILRNNIYGVDLNEESVEITKLSLWLKTAQKGKKLTTLDNNIKCGNSLIEDPRVAGEKAFNWQEQFTDIFKHGGFDVVIGNPPYVNSKHIAKADRDYLWSKNLEVLQMDMDLYQVFLYMSIEKLLKQDGFIGFITPDSYFANQSFKKMRQYLVQKNQIINIVDFPYRFFPFDDVNTETSIIIVRKNKKSSYEISVNIVDKKAVINTALGQHNFRLLHTKSLGNETALYINIDNVTRKILEVKGTASFKEKFKLSNRSSLDRKVRWPATSLKSYEKCVFTQEDIDLDSELKEIVAPAILGDGILKYLLHGESKYTNVISADGKRINEQTIQSFSEPKLVGQRITGQARFRLVFAFDDQGLIAMPSVNTINAQPGTHPSDLKALLCVINSRLYNHIYKSIFGESNTNITGDVFETIPLPVSIFTTFQKELSDLSDDISLSRKSLTSTNIRFKKLISSEFSLMEWPSKLNFWWKMEFQDFIFPIKSSLSIHQKDELLDVFEKYRSELLEHESQTQNIEHKIDHLVYDVYGLSSEEIAVIEAS